jgi:hypothetical protein
MNGDAELQGLGDPAGTIDEEFRGSRRTDIARRLIEESQPLPEMGRGKARQLGVHQNRLSFVAAAHQHDRGPEITHPAQVQVPVFDGCIEDRTEEGIPPHAAIEFRNEPLDHRFGDTEGGTRSPGIGTRSIRSRHKLIQTSGD